MTTLVLDENSIGVVVPGPGAITKLEVTSMPDDRWGRPAGPFTLVDTSGPNPRQLYNCEANNVGILVGLNLSTSRGGIGIGPVMSATPIPFGSLLVESVPRGSTFELEVQ
jgi:hypothetical protein